MKHLNYIYYRGKEHKIELQGSGNFVFDINMTLLQFLWVSPVVAIKAGQKLTVSIFGHRLRLDRVN